MVTIALQSVTNCFNPQNPRWSFGLFIIRFIWLTHIWLLKKACNGILLVKWSLSTSENQNLFF